MVDTEHSRVPKMVAQAGYRVRIAALPGLLGVQGREPPVLSLSEYGIGRRSCRGAVNKQVLVPPYVVTVRVHPQGIVEVEPRAVPACVIGQAANLLVA